MHDCAQQSSGGGAVVKQVTRSETVYWNGEAAKIAVKRAAEDVDGAGKVVEVIEDLIRAIYELGLCKKDDARQTMKDAAACLLVAANE